MYAYVYIYILVICVNKKQQKYIWGGPDKWALMIPYLIIEPLPFRHGLCRGPCLHALQLSYHWHCRDTSYFTKK